MSAGSKIFSIGSFVAAIATAVYVFKPKNVVAPTVYMFPEKSRSKIAGLLKFPETPFDHHATFRPISEALIKEGKLDLAGKIPLFFRGINVKPTLDNYNLLKQEFLQYSSLNLSDKAPEKGQYLSGKNS